MPFFVSFFLVILEFLFSPSTFICPILFGHMSISMYRTCEGVGGQRKVIGLLF